jgi:hypothetical protein
MSKVVVLTGLCKEVVNFLEDTSIVMHDANGVKSYVVNNVRYTQTKNKGVYEINILKEKNVSTNKI